DVVRQGAVADDPRRGPPERLPQAPEELRLRRSIPRTELLHQGLIVQSNTSLHRVLRFRSRGRASSVPGDPAALTERWRGLGGCCHRARHTCTPANAVTTALSSLGPTMGVRCAA